MSSTGMTMEKSSTALHFALTTGSSHDISPHRVTDTWGGYLRHSLQPERIFCSLFLATNRVILLLSGTTGSVFDCISGSLGSIANTFSDACDRVTNSLPETWSSLVTPLGPWQL